MERVFEMATIDAILERCRATSNALFDFGPEVLISYLPVDQAREFLKPEVTAEQWEEGRLPLDRETVIRQMGEYMDFAWEKANDERGLSAIRSVQKMQAWLFLLGDAELLAFAENDRNYAPYGKPILRRICDAYELQVEVGS